MKLSGIEINLVRVNYVGRLVRAIKNPLRQRILNLIEVAGSENVTTIYKTLGLQQSLASQHLAILRNAKVVTAVRTGKEVRYSIDLDTANLIDALTILVLAHQKRPTN